ncbi:MAG TPA: cysteine hydrolase family protein [Ohtaekwangia sp.]|nr:cysteine hydrolase family protein [Ohtaekwangia sp.]
MKKPALIVIDVQHGINDAAHWGGNRNNPAAEQNIARLLSLWRERTWPVIIVQHSSTTPTSPFYPDKEGHALMDFVRPHPDDVVIKKSTANAFINTPLDKHLRDQKATTILITGFVTNNSVEATARMAGDTGFNTVVVSDACACFDKTGLDGTKYPATLVHAMALANLKDEYAAIASTEEIINNATERF